MEAESRLEFIDLAKGICILLVVLYHSDNDVFNFPNFQALRMPLYFVLSGMFFKAYGSGKEFIFKKINNLIIPFLFWMVISWVHHFAIIYIKSGELYSPIHLLDFLTEKNVTNNVALWFLFCLFISNLVFYSLNKYFRGLKLPACVLFIAFCGNLLGYCHVRLPFWIDSAFTALPFFYVGKIIGTLRSNKRYSERIFGKYLTMKQRYQDIAVALILIGLSYMIYFFFPDPYFGLMTNEQGGIIVVSYLNSLFFVFGVLIICKILNRIPLISFIGRYSIIILCVQWFPLYHIHGIIDKFMLNSDLASILNLTFIIFVSVLLIPFCKKILPFFTAQKNMFQKVGILKV